MPNPSLNADVPHAGLRPRRGRWLPYSLGHMEITGSRLFGIAVIAVAAALHAYEQLAKSSAPALGWFVWSMVPYGVGLVVLLRAKSGIPGAFGVSIALALDIIAHYDVFVNPKGSTAALALLFVPLWSALVFVPAAMLNRTGRYAASTWRASARPAVSLIRQASQIQPGAQHG